MGYAVPPPVGVPDDKKRGKLEKIVAKNRINGNNGIDVQVPIEDDNLTMQTLAENQITFCWENLTIEAPVKNKAVIDRCLKRNSGAPTPPKVILKDASGFVRPGELLAIMGASGAGKSTLLNALTFRNLSGLNVISGTRYANGIKVSPNSLTSVSAYVQQDDLFIGTLTVREHLVFQALVRMDREVSRQNRMTMVDSVITELGLSKCSKTLIGVPGRIKGISGGEMKRLSFASEVLTNPPLMFCDEPTSGLDSYMAQNVVEVMRSLAKKGKTVVATIHQPSSQVFDMFDRVLLMAEGRVAFMGGMKDAVDFFARLNYPCPLNYNPADHFVHVLAVIPGKEKACKDRVNMICDAFESSKDGGKTVQEFVDYQKNHIKAIRSLKEGPSAFKSPYKATWWEQFKALLWRSVLAVLKEPMLMKVRIVQTVMIALLLGIIYFGQDTDQKGIMNINGAIFLMLTNVTFQNLFAVVNVFCMELPIFLREHFNGTYRTDVYYFTKQLAEFPIFLITGILFPAIFYYMVGLNPEVSRFFYAVLIIILLTQVVAGVGYMISCIASSLQVALSMGPPMVIPFMLFGGFFLNSKSIPVWLAWIKYISWFYYGNEALMINQWQGVQLKCPDAPINVTISAGDSNSTQPKCFKDGEAVLEFYGFEEDHFAFDIVMLFVLLLAFRFIGFLALLSKTYRKSK